MNANPGQNFFNLPVLKRLHPLCKRIFIIIIVIQNPIRWIPNYIKCCDYIGLNEENKWIDKITEVELGET